MDNIKNDEFFLKKIKDDLEYLIGIGKGLEREGFEKSVLHQDSVMFRLVQISENADKLSKEFKESHSEIVWKQIKGMRNKIVHDYGVVDLKIVYDTLKIGIPELYEAVKKLI